MSSAAAVSFDKLDLVFANMPHTEFAPLLASQGRNNVHHVINRLTFGPTADLVDYVNAIGIEAFIEEQLNPATLNDSYLEQWADFLPDLGLNAGEIIAKYEGMAQPVFGQLVGNWAIRALASKRQLYERMVHFWSDHFSIFADGQLLALKVDDDRDVIRQHALGNFRDLLGASAHSPAMLVYLDNALSEKTAPNENYGRELLELHTLGINGGYTELDVKAAARAFTGWSANRPRDRTGTNLIQFRFNQAQHDENEKTFMGITLPANGGETDGEIILDLIASHPSTARYVCTKLARRFVSDNPPDSIIEACATTFLETNGDIKSILRTLFAHEEFWNAPPKFKRPWEYTFSTLRVMNYEITDPNQLMRSLIFVLQNLGHVPFRRSTPDGYPDTQTDWADNLLMRWNIAIAAVHRGVPGAQGSIKSVLESHGIELEAEPILRFMGQLLYGRELSGEETQILTDYLTKASDAPIEDLQDALALLLAAPAFQYR